MLQSRAQREVIGGESIHQLGYGYVLFPVGSSALVILTLAILLNAPFPWRRYPVVLARRSRPLLRSGAEPSHEDVVAALRQMNPFMDIDEDDLRDLIALAQENRRKRREATTVSSR